MTVVTLNPNGTTFAGGVVVGAATAHQALNDSSDASYLELTPSDLGELTLDDLSLPAGAVVKVCTLKERSAKIALSPILNTSLVVLDDPLLGGGNQTWVGGGNRAIGWTTPTDVSCGSSSTSNPTFMASDSRLDASRIWFFVQNDGDADIVRVYKAWVEVTYVTQPTLVVDDPTGTITDTNRPTVAWTPTLDSDGGAQARWEVKVFNDAQYLAGGFDPATSTPFTESTEIAGADSSYQVADILPDDTYRAYVRVAQTVNGSDHWSAWAFSGFVVDVDLPAVPSISVVPDSAEGKIRVTGNDNVGAATTDALEFQRSLDGGTTWEALRILSTDEGDGVVLGTDADVWDFEAANGTTTHYRVRALHDYSGAWAASDWASDSDLWTSEQAWLKDPLFPSRNLQVTLRSYSNRQRSARQGVFQPLGSGDIVVVTDARAPYSGEVIFRCDAEADREALDGLLGNETVLLLQTPGRPDRYLRLGDQSAAYPIDNAMSGVSFETLAWVEVPAPSGGIDEWPPA